MNIFYVRPNKTTFNTAEMLFKKSFLEIAIFILIFSTCSTYKKLLFLQLIAKAHSSFFGSTEQDRNYGGTSPLKKCFAFRGKKC